jgi:hypothetical protein
MRLSVFKSDIPIVAIPTNDCSHRTLSRRDRRAPIGHGVAVRRIVAARNDEWDKENA